MTETKASKYWLDQVVDEAIKQHPEGEIITASGHAPSGQYHFGHLRELMTPSVIVWGIEQRGRKARHLDFVDDFDPLRKIPAGIPKTFEEHLGKPLYLAPDPFPCKHDSYAEHFLEELYQALEKLGIKPEIIRSHKVYQAGKFTDQIEKTLQSLDKINQIVQEVSGRQLPKGWVPIQLLADDERLDSWTYQGWNRQKQTVKYEDKSGQSGELDYTKGRVKLNWRVDWPARWQIWQVAVEPFGRDHASKGGSYDTGKELAKQVFKTTPPLPLPFDFINLIGHTKKMSASAGTGVTPNDILAVLPAELMRYFIVKARPNKTLEFDTGTGIVQLWQEYKEVEAAVSAGKDNEFKRAYETANAGSKGRVTSDVPFDHLVSVYQAALGDKPKINSLLERSGYEKAVKTQASQIEQEIKYVENWLNKFAPQSAKFSVQKRLAKVELTEAQKQFLANLADAIDKMAKPDGQAIHEAIYELKDQFKLQPAQAFQAIYRVILGQDSGPKAGWFLSTLDKKWVVKRLKLEA